jgi:hypothetical protein
MTKDEAIEILEGIAKDEDANPTSRVTAIRALLELRRSRSRRTPSPTPRHSSG